MLESNGMKSVLLWFDIANSNINAQQYIVMFEQMQAIPYKSKWEAGSPNLTTHS